MLYISALPITKAELKATVKNQHFIQLNHTSPPQKRAASPYCLDKCSEIAAKTHSFLFFPFFLPFPDTQDKLDGKQLAPEVRETGAIALGSLVGKLCRQRLRGLQVSPCYTPPSPDPKTPRELPKTPPGPLRILLHFCFPAKPDQEVERGVEAILAGLRGAKEEPEAVIHLLALGNAALPETIPILLEHAEEGPAAISAAAISALRRFPARHISSEV